MRKKSSVWKGCAFLLLRLLSAGLTIAATYFAFAQNNALVAVQFILGAFWIEVLGAVAFNGRRQQ